MKRFSQKSFVSFVNAKASCRLLCDIGWEKTVMTHFECSLIPLFAEENLFVEHVLNVAIVAVNTKALFQLRFMHAFSFGGDLISFNTPCYCAKVSESCLCL